MTTSGSHHLLRVLGTAFGIAVVVGGTVGQGIMRTPGIVAGGLPIAWMILALWLAGGLFALVDSMSAVELSTSIQTSGGPYAFTRRAFGPVFGLGVGLTDWLGNCAAVAYVAVVFSEYLHRLGLATSIANGMLAPLLPLAACLIQLLGTKIGGASQEIGSAVKALAYTVLILALLLGSHHDAGVAAAMPDTAFSVVGLIVAVQAVIGAYTGWMGGTYFVEEMKGPAKAVVRATFIGIAAIMAVYLLMNVALLHAMRPSEMAGSDLVAADAAARVFGAASPFVSTGITLISLISVVTLTNVMVMQYPRVLFAIARDADVPVLSEVAANGTPRAALLLTAVAGAAFAMIGVYAMLLALSTVLLAAVSASVNAAAIRMRWKEPSLDRPWRMPLFPLPALFALIVNGALTVAFALADLKTAAIGFTVLALVTAMVWLAIWLGKEEAAFGNSSP